MNLLNSWALIKWLVSGILFLISIACVFRAALVARLVILGIFFSISLTFSLRAEVVTSPLVLGIFLLTSSIFFSRPCLSEFYCALLSNPLVLGALIAFTFVANVSYTDFLTFHCLLNCLAYSDQLEQILLYLYLFYQPELLSYNNSPNISD